MASQIPEEHIRHYMLFEFRKGSNATVATTNICDVYSSALDVRRPTTLDNDMLWAEVEANSCQTIEKLSNTLNQPWSTIQEHLQQIRKISRAGVWVHHNLAEENKANRSITCNVLLQRHHTEPQWLSPNELPRSTAKPGLHPKKALLCVWWSIRGIVHFEVLKPGQTVNADLYCKQLDRVNQSLIEKPHCARQTLEKINELGWEVLPHPTYSPDITPSDLHLFRSLQHFLSGKKFENLDNVQNAISRIFVKTESSNKPRVPLTSGEYDRCASTSHPNCNNF
ncbi:histone-lysine N-methyltransferase SETMAR-like [Vespa velutina]|uniref:histone-lysine N-methyltransferase SETMAR-like n=1 Tax=Vespa velutina TaxID=202808 RepID=UPI001FB33279|nr:histone-lysine N-methyltransferase SETMAR-like [Vespa velutina]